MIFQPRGIHKNFDADLILRRFTIVSTTLYASTNFFAAETTLQSYASYLFLKQQFNKYHVSCDTFTSTCRMTMIFLLTYSQYFKEYFEYLYHVFKMIHHTRTAV